MKFIEKVGAIIISQDRKTILLLHELSWSVWGYNIPKGTVDRSRDSDMISAMKREIFEETWLCFVDFQSVLGVYPKTREEYISLLTIFVYTSQNQKDELLLHNSNQEKDENISHYKWIWMSDFLRMNSDDFLDVRVYRVLSDVLPKIFSHTDKKSLGY